MLPSRRMPPQQAALPPARDEMPCCRFWALRTCRGLIAASSAICTLSRIAQSICSSSVYSMARGAPACGDEKE
jgi:hypothetical protein